MGPEQVVEDFLLEWLVSLLLILALVELDREADRGVAERKQIIEEQLFVLELKQVLADCDLTVLVTR